jgi:hypothetical protein
LAPPAFDDCTFTEVSSAKSTSLDTTSRPSASYTLANDSPSSIAERHSTVRDSARPSLAYFCSRR